MKKLTTTQEQIRWAAFLVKLEGALRKPKQERYVLVNQQLRRVA